MSKIQSFLDIYATFQQQARDTLKEAFVEFWEKNPGINAVVWTQFTPYFRDGEACEFSVGEPTFTNAQGEDLGDVWYDEYDGDTPGVWANMSFQWSDQSLPEGVDVKYTEELSAFLCSTAAQSAMKTMFGDHVRVVATREGFDINKFDHD